MARGGFRKETGALGGSLDNSSPKTAKELK